MLQIFNCIILTISLSEIWRRFLHHFENGHLRPLFCLSSVFVQQIYYKVSIWYLGLAFKLTRSKSRVSLYYKRAHPCFSLYCAMAGRFNLTVSSISFANIVPKCRAMAFPFILSIVASLVRVSLNKGTKYGPDFFTCARRSREISAFLCLSRLQIDAAAAAACEQQKVPPSPSPSPATSRVARYWRVSPQKRAQVFCQSSCCCYYCMTERG